MRTTLSELIDRDGVEADISRSGERVPERFHPDSSAWQVTLRRDGKELVTPFFTGPSAGPVTAQDVLGCMLSDASCGEMSFPEYVTEFDEDDSPTREVYATWEGCVKAGESLREFLGDDYDTYLHAER